MNTEATMDYTQEQIQAAMERWAATPDTKERIKNWFYYVDARDGRLWGSSYQRYLGTLRPLEAREFQDA